MVFFFFMLRAQSSALGEEKSPNRRMKRDEGKKYIEKLKTHKLGFRLIQLHKNTPVMFSARSTLKTMATNVKPTQQVRYKRDKAGLNPQLERIVNQLSVMSAGRKQPRLLKLCNEDYVKHRTVMKAWSLYRKSKIQQREDILKKQYESMESAAEELKAVNPKLYEIANQHQYGKRFPLEIRIPTEYPARQIWFYDYFPKVDSKQ